MSTRTVVRWPPKFRAQGCLTHSGLCAPGNPSCSYALVLPSLSRSRRRSGGNGRRSASLADARRSFYTGDSLAIVGVIYSMATVPKRLRAATPRARPPIRHFTRSSRPKNTSESRPRGGVRRALTSPVGQRASQAEALEWVASAVCASARQGSRKALQRVSGRGFEPGTSSLSETPGRGRSGPGRSCWAQPTCLWREARRASASIPGAGGRSGVPGSAVGAGASMMGGRGLPERALCGQEEARFLRHNYIGTEHILLGLLREEEGLAARMLESMDLTVERVRAQVVRIVGSGEEVTSGEIPFTPRAKKALKLARREARVLGHATSAPSTSCSAWCARTRAWPPASCSTSEQTRRRSATRSSACSPVPGDRSPSDADTAERSLERIGLSDALLDGAGPPLRALTRELDEHHGRPADAGDLLLLLAHVPDGLVANALAALGINPEKLTRIPRGGPQRRRTLKPPPSLRPRRGVRKGSRGRTSRDSSARLRTRSRTPRARTRPTQPGPPRNRDAPAGGARRSSRPPRDQRAIAGSSAPTKSIA